MQTKTTHLLSKLPSTLGDFVASAYDHYALLEHDPSARSQRVAACVRARLDAHPQLVKLLFT
jgi:hypothetical protein